MPRQVAASVQYAFSCPSQPSPRGARAVWRMCVPSSALDSARSPASNGRTLASTRVRIGMPMIVMARPAPSDSPVTSQVKYTMPSGRPSR